MKLFFKILTLVIFSTCLLEARSDWQMNHPEGMAADSCRITNMEEISFRCLGNDHYLTFDLERENEGVDFRLFRNLAFVNTYVYENLPVEVGPFSAPSGGQATLRFEDKTYLYCMYSQVYTAPNCIGCEIENITYIIQNCQNGQYLIQLNFDHTNTNDFFTYAVDDVLLDTFSYDVLPLVLGPFSDANPVYQIEIRDLIQPNCFVDFGVNSPMCTPVDCELTNFSINQTSCVDEQYNLVIDFDYIGQSSRFEFWLDGEYIGEYTYNSLPLIYGPLFTPNDLLHSVQVVDVVEQTCFTGGTIELEDCTGVCELSDLELTQVDCAEGEYFININITTEFSSDEAEIYVDGTLVSTRQFSDFPLNIGPFQSTGELGRMVRVVDSMDGLCFVERFLNVIDCRPECELSQPQVNILPCNELEFSILLDFEHSDTNNEFFVIDLSGNDFGTFLYSDLPVEIGPFEGDAATQYILSVFDEGQDCDLIVVFTAADCEPTSLYERKISEIQIFPNPASTYFSIPDLKDGSLVLTDLNGKEIRTWERIEDNYSLQGIPAGIYIVRWNNKGQNKIGKLHVSR